MNSTVDVATAEGWFASGQRTQTIFFSPPLPPPPPPRAHMWNRGWGHETGELSTRPTRGWAKSGPSVFSWDGLIDDEGRGGERERERERRWIWFVSESGNYCTMSFSQDGRKNGEFIIRLGGISFSKLRAKLKPLMRRGVVMFGCF